ncbi:MAG: hypothetical protein H5U38_01740 [Calditrichaeota bacterium]|nr:hypothetical protein [Calditrichota bacterium]
MMRTLAHDDAGCLAVALLWLACGGMFLGGCAREVSGPEQAREAEAGSLAAGSEPRSAAGDGQAVTHCVRLP